jgi:hypothetical protein
MPIRRLKTGELGRVRLVISCFWDYGAILEVQCGSREAISAVGVNYNVSNGQDSGRKVILFGNFGFVGLRSNSGIALRV